MPTTGVHPRHMNAPSVPTEVVDAGSAGARITVGGKFFEMGAKKWPVRGVTYGPFAPMADGSEYHTPALVRQDFAAMSAAGFNAVRLYTVPPLWLLDAAGEA